VVTVIYKNGSEIWESLLEKKWTEEHQHWRDFGQTVPKMPTAPYDNNNNNNNHDDIYSVVIIAEPLREFSIGSRDE